ncbi:hypothetical protein [Natrarchaeobius oligotrophus]|uniref:Uncharacterized protein n=1 Tax=Natrarchaeobius chitinivorans TaxID=1679083 RepID=A0A3N6LU65_NATCH|nr:hypothetical protein [Natrarchaeobius chitinivorans]RQG93753.1 hypothetical protein EA472_22755 [Natrarchaeobius chitinivorans]
MSDDNTSSGMEQVRYRYQGALFRIVTKEVSGLEAVYLEKKRSCDDEWKQEKKLGWREHRQVRTGGA